MFVVQILVQIHLFYKFKSDNNKIHHTIYLNSIFDNIDNIISLVKGLQQINATTITSMIVH